MFLNCNEEIKRQKEQTIRSQNRFIGRICSGARGRGAGTRGNVLNTNYLKVFGVAGKAQRQ
jgi:hypothetical protein